MFALIDCNNFFASCEMVFNPKLKNKPVVVLSNNDGCVIARSKEAKKLNIKMADPIFLHKNLVESKLLHVFSSNFTLYGDMSKRVMQTLLTFLLPIEIYSIDEAFLKINKDLDLLNLGKIIKDRIYKWTGIEVSIGIAKTKTLAKLATEIAKKNTENNGIFILTDPKKIKDQLLKTDVVDIWGIGKNLQKRLYRLGVFSALDLLNTDSFLIKKKLSVNVYKTCLELQGISCLKLEDISQKKSILSSRSFSKKISDLTTLEKAISKFTSIAAEKLRKQKLHANFLTVFIRTSFHSQDPFYSNSYGMKLPISTSYTPDLITYSKKALKLIFKKGFLYKKAGILLNDFSSEEHIQLDFFKKSNNKKKNALMEVVDKINHKSNKKAIFFASDGTEKKYITSGDFKSKKCTTSFDELLEVK